MKKFVIFNFTFRFVIFFPPKFFFTEKQSKHSTFSKSQSSLFLSRFLHGEKTSHYLWKWLYVITCHRNSSEKWKRSEDFYVGPFNVVHPSVRLWSTCHDGVHFNVFVHCSKKKKKSSLSWISLQSPHPSMKGKKKWRETFTTFSFSSSPRYYHSTNTGQLQNSWEFFNPLRHIFPCVRFIWNSILRHLWLANYERELKIQKIIIHRFFIHSNKNHR